MNRTKFQRCSLSRFTSIFAGMLLCFSLNLHADEPTEEETVEFIATLLKGCQASVGYEGRDISAEKTYKYHDFTVEGGRMSLDETVSETVYKAFDFLASWKSTWNIHAELSDLDPAIEIAGDVSMIPISPVRVHAEGRVIKIHCAMSDCFKADVHKEHKSYNSEGRIQSNTKEEYTTNTMLVCNKRDAKRVANAFSHLIKLHGGEESPF